MDSSQSLSLRGISEAFGYILLLTVVVVGVFLIIYLGAGTVSDLREDATKSQADAAFSDLNAVVSSVAMSHPEAQSEYTLGLIDRGGSVTFGDEGHITMGVDENGDGSIDTEVLNTPLRTVTYQHDDYEVVSQGGAVFSHDSSQAERNLVSPPSLRRYDVSEQCDPYRTHPFLVPCQDVNDPSMTNNTVSFSVITFDQYSVVGDTMYIRQTRDTRTEMLDKLDEDDQFIIEIDSEYHEEWEQYAVDNIEDAEIETTIAPDKARIVIDGDEDIFFHIVRATIGLQ